MRKKFRTANTLVIAICGIATQFACHAQSTSSSAGEATRPRVDFAELSEVAKVPLTLASTEAPVASTSAAASSASAPDPATAAGSNPSAAVTVPLTNDAVIKELAEMKTRIAQLEAELRANNGAADAERDANALRTAEGAAVSGASSSSVTPGMQAAAPPPPAATPAPPEISAERTTKETPFPGDWTWLNSNGHAVDSPMATKYFTPEFRADANYILDYNHPHDDTMGGATESFRSDEWQLEQISIGGDIRIDNVRGRILTMNGLFATTTPRNDASPSRGQWDLAGAYKYVSEAWGVWRQVLFPANDNLNYR